MISWIKGAVEKHNERILIKNGFVRCAYCRNFIHKSDKYCQYCGKKITGTKIFYLCDGEVPSCKKRTCYKHAKVENPCRHTTDIHHAANFEQPDEQEVFFEADNTS